MVNTTVSFALVISLLLFKLRRYQSAALRAPVARASNCSPRSCA